LAETDELWVGNVTRASLLMKLRDKPSEVPTLLIVATSAATEARGTPIVKSFKKPNVRSLARDRRNGWATRQKRSGPNGAPC